MAGGGGSLVGAGWFVVGGPGYGEFAYHGDEGSQGAELPLSLPQHSVDNRKVLERGMAS